MGLQAGTRLGSFEVEALLGAGGMGEVYRARDVKLGREVAIKVLPEGFALDAERLTRLGREAHILASLNHPNIAAIYGFETSENTRFLVLELVPGPTLAERLRSGPIALEECVDLMKQVAEALEAAHEKGIIHRDLKPANIKLTPEGRVKVLDFGLAKGFDVDGAAADPSLSPTATYGTEHGAILGTPAYMSPEQARGKTLDKRSDVWSFGCVLFEALTGRKAFGGDTLSDTMATVLRGEPDWSSLQPGAPPRIRELLEKCLEKDPRRRLHDIADARIEIERVHSQPVAVPSPAPKSKWSVAAIPLSLIAGIVVGAVVLDIPRARSTNSSVVHLSINLPPNEALTAEEGQNTLAFSPDGRRLAYIARQKEEGGADRDYTVGRVYVRELDRPEPTLLAGTEGARSIAFSPDSEWVAFFSGDQKLRKVPVTGGAPSTIADLPQPTYRGINWGFDWALDGTMVVVPDTAVGLMRIGGGTDPLDVLTRPDPARGEVSHRWPHTLPHGQGFLFTVKTRELTSWDDAPIAALSPSTGEWRAILDGGTGVRYLPTGHLLFGRGGALHAVPFDLRKLEVTGTPVKVLDDVWIEAGKGHAHYSVSETGSLAYIPGSRQLYDRELLWVDREGRTEKLLHDQRPIGSPRLSPDGKLLAVKVFAPSDQVWIADLARGALTRLTFDLNNEDPTWSPDGTSVAVSSDRAGALNLYRQPADGSGPAERLTTSDNPQRLDAWSPDGRFLVFTESDPATGWDIWILPLDGDRKARPFLRTPFYEGESTFSSDGRFLAYTSDESGRREIYVRSFTAGGGKRQISIDGGTAPVWSRDGREIFYWHGRGIMSVAVSTTPVFSAGKPRRILEGPYDPSEYDVSPDGKRFVVILSRDEQRAPRQINVVLNWFEELKERVRNREH